MFFSPVIEAKYIQDYRVLVSFKDGITGEIDLSDQLWGEIFEPLKDKKFFSQLRVDPEIRTIVWPNGADFSPEFIYQRAVESTKH